MKIHAVSRSASMIEILPLLCIVAAILLLIILSAIDLKYLILPDELNFVLALTGLAFHVLTGYAYASITDMLAGAATGAGLLYVIRFFSNRHYGRDTLGLGDVKLLGAAGIWLGLEGVLQAVTLGAAAGLVHGLGYAGLLWARTRVRPSLSALSIPAGPGFAVGILAAGWFMLGDYISEAAYDLFA